MNTLAPEIETHEPQRGFVQSQWPSLVFYGAPYWPKPKAEDPLVDLIGDGSQISALSEDAIILDNGVKIKNGSTKEKGRPTMTTNSAPKISNADDPTTLRFKGRAFSASGRTTPHGFLIFAGSTVNHLCGSFLKDTTYYPRRMEMEADGTIKGGLFTRDAILPTAQMAASIVAGRVADARVDWKADDGRTYAELHPKARQPLTAAKVRKTTESRRTRREENTIDNFIPYEEIDGIHYERHLTEQNGRTVLIEHRW